MTLFRFCHAQKNAFAFFVALTFREIAVGLRGLDFRLPVAPCSIDRLLMVFPLGGHAALKRKKCRLPHENSQFSDNRWPATCRPQRAEGPRSRSHARECRSVSLDVAIARWKGSASMLLAEAGILPACPPGQPFVGRQIERLQCSSLHTANKILNQQAPSRRSRRARRALVAAVP